VKIRLKSHTARYPYPNGKQKRKVLGCALRLERVARGKVPEAARPYLEAAQNALGQALREWNG